MSEETHTSWSGENPWARLSGKQILRKLENTMGQFQLQYDLVEIEMWSECRYNWPDESEQVIDALVLVIPKTALKNSWGVPIDENREDYRKRVIPLALASMDYCRISMNKPEFRAWMLVYKACNN